MVFVVTLILVERIVRVDVLDIGGRAVGGGVGLSRVGGRGRVALHAAVVLVAVEDGSACRIPVGAPVEVVVVAGWVVERREGIVAPAFQGLGRCLRFEGLDVVGIGGESHLVGGGETVETDVLCRM